MQIRKKITSVFFAILLIASNNTFSNSTASSLTPAMPINGLEKPFSAFASALREKAKHREVLVAAGLLVFMINSFHTLFTQSSLKDEDCKWENFKEDVSCTMDALIHGDISGFCSGVHRLWRVYFVGRTRKLVDVEVKTISEDGKTEKTVKDKDLVRLEFGFCGWLACAGGAMKDIFEKAEPMQKTLAFVGLISLLGLNQQK